MAPTQESEIAVTVTVEALFPGVNADEAALRAALAELSRDDALFFCGRLNALVSGFGPQRTDAERQIDALRWIGTADQVRALERFAAPYGGVQNVRVFFRGQLLELARWVVTHCENQPGDGDTSHDPAKRTAFVRAALIVSGLWAQRVFGAHFSGAGDEREQQLHALGPFRKSVEEGNRAPEAHVALSRGWLLFSRYLPRHDPDFPALFARATGLTVQEYFVAALALLKRTFTDDPDGPSFSTSQPEDPSPIRPIFERYVRLKSQTPEEWAQRLRETPEDDGYKVLRERPILTFPGNRSLILDPSFYSDNLMTAPLFHVATLPEVNANQVFGAFGDAFEDYALDVLKKRYPTSSVLAPRLRWGLKAQDAANRQFEVDALINDVTEGVVAEIKAPWIRDDKVLNPDPQVFLEEVRRKYGYQPGSKDRGKGPAQLARSVGALVRREWTGEQGEYARLQSLHPVLIVHDTRLAQPVLARFLEEDFRAMLGPVPQGMYVHKLTILTIEDLERLTCSVEQLSLTQFLHAYSAADPDRISSVQNFIARSEFRIQVRPSPVVEEAMQELLKVIRGEFARNNASSDKS